jgi:hypothetical protein
VACSARIRIQCIGDPLNGEVWYTDVNEKAGEALKSYFKLLDTRQTARYLVLEAGKSGYFGVEPVACLRKIVGDIGKVGCESGVRLT